MLRISDFFGELKLKDNAHVADFGCGIGENAKILSENLPHGKIFAVDVYKDLLEHLQTEIRREAKKEKPKLQNIVTVWGDIETLNGSRLRDESIDAIIIANTFYLLKHKRTCVLEMRRVLKRGGRILFVDWHKPIGKYDPNHLLSKFVLHEREVERMFTEADMKVYPLIHKDDNHFVLLVEK